jgi:glycerol-3-phosphate dehydrogenase
MEKNFMRNTTFLCFSILGLALNAFAQAATSCKLPINLDRLAAKAAEVVDVVVQRRGGGPGHPPTDQEPLPGGESSTWEPFHQEGLDLGLPPETAADLVRRYGTETAAVLNLVREDRSLLAPIHPGHRAIGAEVIHHVRREFGVRVEDVLARRLHLDTETEDHGRAAANRIAELMGRELGWDAARVRTEGSRVNFVP